MRCATEMLIGATRRAVTVTWNPFSSDRNCDLWEIPSDKRPAAHFFSLKTESKCIFSSSRHFSESTLCSVTAQTDLCCLITSYRKLESCRAHCSTFREAFLSFKNDFNRIKGFSVLDFRCWWDSSVTLLYHQHYLRWMTAAPADMQI